MKSRNPHSLPGSGTVPWFCLALLVFSSPAVAQQATPPWQEAAARVARQAQLQPSTTPSVELPGCCGESGCCSDAATCAECPDCTNCSTGSCQVPRNAMACDQCKGTVPVTPARPLPGQVGFLREHDRHLAEQRDRLADELAEYLTTRPREVGHVREILKLTLEATAESAHRAARDTSETLEVAGLPSSGFASLESEMAETRQMILETRRDLQLMNDSLQFLARHMARQHGDSPAPAAGAVSPGSVAWQSQPTRMPPAVDNELDSVHRLQQQVRDLEVQLRQSREANHQQTVHPGDQRPEQRLATSWDATGQLQPTNWQREPLRPIAEVDSPLRPAANPGRTVPRPVKEQLVWRHYYVGDMVSPPFAASSFRLIQHIKSQIAPDTWRPESIQIAAPSVSLLVLQTPENHQRLETLLTEMGATMLR